MQYLVSNTPVADEKISAILNKGVNIIIRYRTDPSAAWRAEGDDNGNTFYIYADTRLSLEYKVDRKAYVYPLSDNLIHELDHGERYADRDGAKIRNRQVIIREEEALVSG